MLCCATGLAPADLFRKGPQASSLTAGPGDGRMNLERNKYGHNTIEKNSGRSGRDPETSKARHAKV